MFRKETEFQETEIGEIPKDWKIEKLKNIVIKAKMGGTPRSTVREYWGGDIPFAKVEDITSSHKYLFKTSTTITKIGLESSNAWIIPKDSLLITIYGTLGAVAINKIELATNQAIVGIIPRKDIVDVEYLYYWYSFFQPNWNKYVKKSTQPNLTLEIVTNSKLPLPSIKEQKRIANILSMIDSGIESVDRAIAKLEGLKKALMRELLTGRIRVREENGKTAFYRETEFQDTEIGKIPREWKIERLKNVAMEIKSGFASGKRDETDGIIHLRMFNIGLNGMLSFDEIIKVPKPRDWRQYLLRHGDILLVNTSGSEEHIGKVAIFENVELECTYSNHLTRIRINENEVDSRWVYFVLYYLWQTGYFKSLVHQQAGGQRNIPLKAIENLPITLPPTNEARKIAEFLSMINTVIKLYREEMIRLERLKRGLMDLLLTGKIRVGEG
jgi:type I restriction enzyme S subunit